MKIGIKTGLKNDPRADLTTTNPDFCEIWFHSGKVNAYTELFDIIKKQGCEHGLHFWGALEDGTLANLSYPNREVLEHSIELVKKTIDCAAEHNSWYVNVHPGGARRGYVDFEHEQFTPYGETVSFEKSQEVLLSSVSILAEYAKVRNVEFLVESVPNLAIGTPWHGPTGRLKPVKLHELPLAYYEPVFKLPNVYFTNDFGHSACNKPDAPRNEIHNYLLQVSKKLCDVTKLLHVSYIIEPYNGSDYHGHLAAPEFTTDLAIPNKTEMIELLRLYKDRTDIGALVEPAADHVGNFRYLKELMSAL